MMRSSVVLPEPEGPSSATSSPGCMSSADVAQRRIGAEVLLDALDADAEAVRRASVAAAACRERVGVTPFEEGLEHQA